MVEKFSNFAPEKGLTLPHEFELFLELQTNAGTVSYTWTMQMQQFTFDQEIKAGDFDVSG